MRGLLLPVGVFFLFFLLLIVGNNVLDNLTVLQKAVLTASLLKVTLILG